MTLTEYCELLELLERYERQAISFGRSPSNELVLRDFLHARHVLVDYVRCFKDKD